MDNKSGGQNSSNSAPQDKNLTSEERQRQTAIDLARQKVLNAYKTQPQNYKSADAPSGQQYNSGTPQINQEEWKKYHSAWQNYYQKYYSEYYSSAAKNYIEKERLKDSRNKAEEEAMSPEEFGKALEGLMGGDNA